MKCFSAILGLLAVAACGSKPAAQAPVNQPPAAKAAPKPAATPDAAPSGTFFGPADFAKLVEDSDVKYEITASSDANTDLSATPDREGISALLIRAPDKDGKLALTIAEPTKQIGALYEQAAQHLQSRDLDRALELSEQAVALDPDYFKSYTYLGNIHFARREFAEAETNFKKALALNPIDYQAYFFLADTYLGLGKPRLALAAITRAYVLNRNNPRLAQVVDRVADFNGFSVRPDRLVLPFEIEVLDKERIRITFTETPEAMQWLSMAMCLATWQIEPSVKQRVADLDEFEREQFMWRECLANLAVSAEVYREGGDAVSEHVAWLSKAVIDGYSDVIVLWEIFAPRYPNLMAAVPDEQRAVFEEYVTKYVYQRKGAP